MSRKPWLKLYSNLLYKMGQHFLERQEALQVNVQEGNLPRQKLCRDYSNSVRPLCICFKPNFVRVKRWEDSWQGSPGYPVPVLCIFSSGYRQSYIIVGISRSTNFGVSGITLICINYVLKQQLYTYCYTYVVPYFIVDEVIQIYISFPFFCIVFHLLSRFDSMLFVYGMYCMSKK